MLLGKLVEISNGKWSSVPHAGKLLPPLNKAAAACKSSAYDTRSKITTSNTITRSVSQSSSNPINARSLNIEVRRKEASRIEQENIAIAKRLFDRGAQLNKKMFDEEYRQHQKYLKALKKVSLCETPALALQVLKSRRKKKSRTVYCARDSKQDPELKEYTD